MGLVLAALVVVVAVAVGRGGDDESCAPPREASADELALLPEGLSFDGIGTVTDVRREPPHVTAEAVTTKPLDEVTVLIQDAVTAAGYRPAGMDNEGDEAEVFFTTSENQAGGQARLEESGCEGRWDVELVLVEPAAG